MACHRRYAAVGDFWNGDAFAWRVHLDSEQSTHYQVKGSGMQDRGDKGAFELIFLTIVLIILFMVTTHFKILH